MRALALLLLFAAQLPAAEAARALEAPTASPTPAPLVLTGRWGVGFDSIVGASAGTGLIPALATPNALAVRYWVNERLAWDGLLALDLSSQPAGGSGSAGVPAGTDQRGYGVGTVLKLNLKRPSRYLLAQALMRASLASLQQVSNSGANSGSGQTTTTFGVGLGLGFEAFLPAWDALSVEGSVGLNFSSSQTKAEGPNALAQSGSTLGISSNGFTPLNVAVHLYF